MVAPQQSTRVLARLAAATKRASTRPRVVSSSVAGIATIVSRRAPGQLHVPPLQLPAPMAQSGFVQHGWFMAARPQMPITQELVQQSELWQHVSPACPREHLLLPPQWFVQHSPSPLPPLSQKLFAGHMAPSAHAGRPHRFPVQTFELQSVVRQQGWPRD